MVFFQQTSKMASVVHASQLLLLTLLSWTVHCFPTKQVGGLSTVWRPDAVPASSPYNAPAQPSSGNPLVSSNMPTMAMGPQMYPANTAPEMYNMATWDAVPVEFAPVPPMSQPQPYYGLPPPPPPPSSSFYQAGEVAKHKGNLEHGISEQETTMLGFPPPPPPFQEPSYQGGELSRYEAVKEHGYEEKETEDQGYRPAPRFVSPYPVAEQMPAPSTFARAPQLDPYGLNEFYQFLYGQHPPGTFSYYNSNHEAGQHHSDELHYEKYPLQMMPMAPKEVPNKQGLWKPQDPSKN